MGTVSLRVLARAIREVMGRTWVLVMGLVAYRVYILVWVQTEVMALKMVLVMVRDWVWTGVSDMVWQKVITGVLVLVQETVVCYPVLSSVKSFKKTILTN